MARAAVSSATRRAPAARSTRAHSAAVAPVVRTSSTRRTRAGGARPPRARNAPAIARRLTHALGARTEPYRVLSDLAVARELRKGGFQVRKVHRQFVLPIALHKAIGSARVTSWSRTLSERSGLLRLFGSPVTLVAERCRF